MDDGVLRAILPKAKTIKLRPAAPRVTDARSLRDEVELSWEAPPQAGFPVSAYRIYRRDGDERARLVGRAPAHRTTFTDRNTVRGEVHHYSIAAVNAAGEGPRSIEAPVLICDAASSG